MIINICEKLNGWFIKYNSVNLVQMDGLVF